MNIFSQSKPARQTLDEILGEDDEFGLLDVRVTPQVRSGDRLAAALEEINVFIDQRGRAPVEYSLDMNERLLSRRLKALTQEASLTSLRALDRHNILTEPTAVSTATTAAAPLQVTAENVTTLDDIFATDDDGLLDLGDADIFKMRHVPAEKDMPEEIAQYRPCEDFFKFEPIFKKLHAELTAGDVEAQRFTVESQIEVGESFILRGHACFVADMGEYTGTHRANPRLRIIFDNGTESNLLKRSFARALYRDDNGRRILQTARQIEDHFNGITKRDISTGMVYVVRIKGVHPALTQFPHLHKIGYTDLTVEERIRNAPRDPAFLEHPVEIAVAFDCYNLNPQKFEALVHGFLSEQRLKLELSSRDGKRYHPREWFTVSLDTARDVVKYIMDGTIVQYRMDNTTGRIVKKTR